MTAELGERVPGKTLTAVTASKAQPREAKYKLAAGGGLYLEVMPTGAKYWRWKYRHGGKEKRLALGVCPEVSLDGATSRTDTAARPAGNAQGLRIGMLSEMSIITGAMT